MNLEKVTELILKQSPTANPALIEKEFKNVKETICPKCVYNINLPADNVCGDCVHVPVNNPEDTFLKEKISSPEDREKRKQLIGVPSENFICSMCNREFHRKDVYELNKHDVCIDCFSMYTKNAARLANETGLAQAIRFLESKTLSTFRYIDKKDYNQESCNVVQNEMHDELWDKVKQHAKTGFYGHIQRGHMEEYNQIHLKCQYTFLSQHDVNMLIKLFYERDVNTEKLLQQEMLDGFFRKENNKIVPTEKCDKPEEVKK